MQVHHGFDVKGVCLHAINDGVGKAMKIEFAVVLPDFAPAFRPGQNAPQRGLVFLQKIATQTRLALLIPERRGFLLLGHLRMPDDTHEAWLEWLRSLLPPGGHPPGPRPSRGNAGQ